MLGTFISENKRLIPYSKCGISKNYIIHRFLHKMEIYTKRIEYSGEFTGKKCKTAILLYCFHTAGVLHIFMLYLGPAISFYRKSKINVKRKPNYEIGWFNN